MMAEKIKILLIKNKLSVADLAKAQSTTPQNLYNKFKRDNFSEQELRKIAEILGAQLEINFILKDGKRI
ncbi:helix-turn-helix domain-containing protein [Sinanaerobacter sp. ZZT-01]|uniref:helix-turn-helix domain-containing protein n=1 Tax=Sinanaerobacter sp. ZZT-01 TaxID=3111540 RepID=UPI002D76A561|nr:helix-turn-helix domain-containing protein [Sinanaerobacter sp. ZZT-01]WRR94164.1 helix-turn-helix domain-containing protein [Sinanaerobacter sp. ZZT-01]